MTCLLGSESYSEMKLTEKLIECSGKDTKVKDEMPYLDQRENKNDFWKDQVMYSLRFLCNYKFVAQECLHTKHVWHVGL